MHRHNRHGSRNINLEIDDDNENYINIDYLDRNNEERINTNKNDISSNLSKIDTNKNNISTNLIKINSNEDDILYTLSEINYIKNNNSKSYIKNIYNILFYDKKLKLILKKMYFMKKYLILILVKTIL